MVFYALVTDAGDNRIVRRIDVDPDFAHENFKDAQRFESHKKPELVQIPDIHIRQLFRRYPGLGADD